MNTTTTDELKSALEKLGAREYEIVALTMLPERGLAALEFALEKGVEHPIAYAIKIFDNAEWNPTGEAKRRATNQSVTTQCAVCGGDRFVLVSKRPVTASQWQREHGIVPPADATEDEYAPCPECASTVDASFFRHDGTKFVPPDPARTREMMER